MGRQLWIGVGILLVLLGIGLLLTVFVENACSPIASLLEQAGNLTEEEPAETGPAASVETAETP